MVMTVRPQPAVTLEIVLALHGCSFLLGLGNRLRCGAQRERCPQPGIEITIAERLLERREGRLTGAVAGCDVLHFVCVAKATDDLFDVRILRHHQMKPPSNEMDAWVDRGCRFHNLVDTRMRAA